MTESDTRVDSAPNRVWVSWNRGEKYGNGATLFIGGADWEHFVENTIGLFGSEIADQIVRAWQDKAAEDLPGGVTQDQAVENVRNAGLAGNEPAHGENRRCAHGEMTYRTGRSTKGPWSGWFCPLPKGNPEQCKPAFA